MALENDNHDDDGVFNLLNAVEKLEGEFENRKEDIEFLKNFITSDDFKILMKAHEAVKVVEKPEKVEKHPQDDTLTLSRIVSYDIEEQKSPECEELYDLLASPYFNSLLMSYDGVINNDYPLQSVDPDEIMEFDEQEDFIKTVRIQKGPRQKLGATVKSDSAGNILIGRIIHGTVAEKCGLLHPGDVIHEINENNLQGMSIDDVGDFMRTLDGNIELKISSSQQSLLPQRRRQGVKHMKALYSYNPTQDDLLPCKEAGLTFNERDILSIFNQDDPEWWQARVHLDSKQSNVGLIPSTKLRERKYYEEASTSQRNQASSRMKWKNKKETEYNPLDSEELGGREVLSYEEVVLIQPQRMQPRPIVLIAPKCGPFSVSDVKAKLIFSDNKLFGGAIPHTSRPPRTGEVHGQHYYFATREELRQKIRGNQFVEHGEHNGHYYGLLINTVRSTINQGKIALMTVVPRVLKTLHQSAELKAYVVFFTMPSDADIHRYWIEKRLVEEKAVPQIRKKTSEMVSMYGRYFDSVVPYNDSDSVTIEIQRIANHLMTEPQWVPSTWIA